MRLSKAQRNEIFHAVAAGKLNPAECRIVYDTDNQYSDITHGATNSRCRVMDCVTGFPGTYTAELDLDVKLVGLKLTRAAADRSLAERSWAEKAAVVEECIRRQQGIGNLAASRGYFTADVEMGWQPCDDNETVVFCGYAGTTLLVLGGSVGNLLSHPSKTGQIGSHPYAIRAALRGNGTPGDIAGDVQASASDPRYAATARTVPGGRYPARRSARRFCWYRISPGDTAVRRSRRQYKRLTGETSCRREQ